MHQPKENMKALIAMSGGVDSSVAAALMLEKGYSCIGVMMKLYERKGFSENNACILTDDSGDAAEVAGKLSIPFRVFDYTDEFRCEVMDRFVNCYLRGETPNPCIDCNRHMKFGRLYELAEALGCDKIVTGHYARISYHDKSGRWQMKKAADITKDQSYVLYSLSQEQLSHACFPLGELTKEKVRSLAEDYGFYNAGKQDSQDICFVPDGDYSGFIEQYLGKRLPEGNFVTEGGKILGTHKGIIHYTIGQRRGLGIAAESPYYVKQIRPETNEVVLCKHEELFRQTLYAQDINWVSISEPDEKIRVQAKIRYRHTAQPGTAEMIGNGLLKLVFDEPQRAITKGQAVVMYDGEMLLGGGTICGAE